MSTWTLRDMDNRDDAGAPHEVIGSPTEIVAYIDTAVRGDLSDGADEGDLNDLVSAFEQGDLGRAQSLGKPFAIYIRDEEASSDE
ncbi:MAG: hypothetical protein ACK4UY_03940 [Dietzia sp.]